MDTQIIEQPTRAGSSPERLAKVYDEAFAARRAGMSQGDFDRGQLGLTQLAWFVGGIVACCLAKGAGIALGLWR